MSHDYQVTPTTQHYWEKIELREEGGTPQIIGAIRAGLTVQLKETVGTSDIEAIELALTQKVLDNLKGIPEVNNITIRSYMNDLCLCHSYGILLSMHVYITTRILYLFCPIYYVYIAV